MAENPVIDINNLLVEAEKTLRDGAYVALGLGILGFQQAQVRRHELAKRLSAQGPLASQLSETAERISVEIGGLSDRLAANASVGRGQLNDLVKTVEARLAPVRRQIDEQIDALEQTFPPAARTAVGTVRSAASDSEARLRGLIGLR